MSAARVEEIERLIHLAMAPDRFRLRGRLRSLKQLASEGKPIEQQLRQLSEHVDRSVMERRVRERGLPPIAYESSLPIHAKRAEIADAIRHHPAVIVCGETGSGKSTQIPKICLEMGRGVDGMIGHTQPRRLAARSIAARLAEELHVPLGQQVGYKIRFTDRTRPETYVKLMTDGMLLAETTSDRFLNQYDTIILDEAHERSLNIDFLLGYVKRLLAKRAELRCIITSATIDAERFSAFFSDLGCRAPVIEVSGRCYPVEVRYQVAEESEEEPDASAQVAAAVHSLLAEQDGDVLVFLPTERDIRETATVLGGQTRHRNGRIEVLPLYARLPSSEQNRVFADHRQQRVVLATNVAESSLTVPGIRAVVDTGTARISRYSPRSQVQRLPIEAVSQASADQRKGRCGRVGPGICIRLYSEEDYLARDKYTTPEIRRTNLASVILQTMALRLGPIEEFPFLDPPRPEAIRDGYRTLFELQAIDGQHELTELGHQLSRLPVDPRVGRMVLAAHDYQCLDEVLIIAAGLEVHDPRERPAEKASAADECHAQFADPSSDFLSILKLWDFYHQLKSSLSRNQLRKACRQNFLSYNRLREWADIYRQLRQLVADTGWGLPARRNDYDSIHQALLTGLLSGVALRADTYSYTGGSGTTLHIWPGSSLFSSRPSWLVAAELVETTRRYCRVVARINPEWIERIAAHLLKRTYSEPHWNGRSGQAMTYERVSLFGLPVVPRRRVPLGPIDPETARQLFIQHALVEGDLPGPFPFLAHNRQVLKDIEQLAAKQRRSDWVVGQLAIFQFYDERLGPQVFDAQRLKRWLASPAHRERPPLLMCREDLLRDCDDSRLGDQFPDIVEVHGARYPVNYQFVPGDEQDGVTVTVPQQAIHQLPDDQLDWLVPGHLEEKITALIRSLPKALRRCFVPAPDTASRIAAQMRFGDGPFLPALARMLEQISGERVPPAAFRLDHIPPHLIMKVRLVGDDGQTLAVDSDLQQLRNRFGSQAPGREGRIDDRSWNRPATRVWDFGDLSDEVTVQRGGLTVRAFPAVIDQRDDVAVRLVDTPDRAAEETRAGVRRLYFIDQRKPLLAHVAWLPNLREIRLLAASAPAVDQLDNQLALLIADRAFIGQDPPRTESAYRARLGQAAERAGLAVQEITPLILPLFESHHQARLAIEQLTPERWKEAVEDVQAQLDRLVPTGFLTSTPWSWLQQYPRYFRAVCHRLDKLRHGGQMRDHQGMTELQPWWQAYRERAEQHRQRAVIDAQLVTFRWMLEEFRVSLFAQPLGTCLPVSSKRLEKQWAALTR